MILMIIAETPFIKSLYENYIIGEYKKEYRFRIKNNRVKKDQLNKNHLIIGKNINIKLQKNFTVEDFQIS